MRWHETDNFFKFLKHRLLEKVTYKRCEIRFLSMLPKMAGKSYFGATTSVILISEIVNPRLSMDIGVPTAQNITR